MPTVISRRTFLAAISAAAALLVPKRVAQAAVRTPHPKPRPGITGAHVLKASDLADKPALIPLYDGVRAIPGTLDGIRCNCNCGSPPQFYSLLSCYEANGMAKDCAVCQGQGRLAVRLKKEGKTLNEIRAAIDAKFG